MRRKLFVIIVVLALVSCKKDSGLQGPGPEYKSVDYLATGTYTYLWSFRGVDSLGTETLSEHDSIAVKIAATGQSQGKYNDLVCMQSTSLAKTNGVSRTWYRKTIDSLIEVCYSGAGQTPPSLPKNGRGGSVLSATIPWTLQRFAARMLSDSVQTRDEPRVAHLYPLTPGLKWICFRSPFYSAREVVSMENVTVNAGTFYCAKIKTTVEFGGAVEDLEWYDYICSQGLILRTFYLPNVIITDESHPDGNGVSISVSERLELVLQGY